VIVVVDAPEQTQLDRLTRIRGMTEADARARMSKQASREQRLAIADYVITNDGDLDALQERVDEVWSELSGRASGEPNRGA
jgi:dephospho-CoA kinase